MPIEPAALVWRNGELVRWEDATVHVTAHALHYGTAVFEGMRCYNTDRGRAVFRCRAHLERLERSARIVRTPLPYAREELGRAVNELIEANELGSCYVRPIAYRGVGELGLNPDACPVEVAIVAWPWDTYFGSEALSSGVRATISSWRRHEANTLPPDAKVSGAYVSSCLATQDALGAGYDEALMLNAAGYVAEGTGENVFAVRDGRLLTPSLSEGPLPGITRDSVIRMARDHGIEVVETRLSRTDLYSADELFFTGTAVEITPIREVDARATEAPGPITSVLQQTFFSVLAGREERYDEWLDWVGRN